MIKKGSRELTRIDANLVEEVKRKREFSQLPDSVVVRALENRGDDVKEARAFLRKYFGVFLTNKVLKGKGVEVLKSHISSKERNYEGFYGKIFSDLFPHKVKGSSTHLPSRGTIIDLGCGVNGFSYEFLPKGMKYVGIEASGQIVDNVNSYFKEKSYDGSVVCMDLLNKDRVVDFVESEDSWKVVFMFQVIDALEGVERNYSKELLLGIRDVLSKEDMIVISFRVEGLSGSGMYAKRKWLVEFLEKEFDVLDDFEIDGERVLLVRG